MGSAADDHDPGRRRQRVEQSTYQREMPEVVDPERHFVAVGGGLRTRNHLHAGIADHGVDRWQPAGAFIVDEVDQVDENVHGPQRCEVESDYRASLRGAESLHRCGTAPRVAHRQDYVPRRVGSQQRACTLQTETGIGSGDDRGSRRI